MKQIVCVKWGTRYGSEYVNKLYGMVSRNITPPFRVVCLTDDRNGIRPEVECFDLPQLACEHPKNTWGKWRKQILWAREVPGLLGGSVALFIDLDSIIVDSIDPYFEYGDENDVILARNWSKPLQKLGQTSVFRFKVGAQPYVYEIFCANPQAIADKYRYEQHHVTATVKGGIKFWPKKWTRMFRLHCLPEFPLRLFFPAKIPQDARIVTFAGGPNPDDIVAGRWSKQVPRRTPWQHILAAFGNGPRVAEKRGRHLRLYVLPVKWIEEYWRE